MSKSNVGKQTEGEAMRWAVLALCVLVAVLVALVAVLLFRPVKVVSSFAQCKEAGGTLMESYPEQCAIGASTFVNSEQAQDGSEYVGMTEADALAKAAAESVPARVVERDGESLPVTMDFTFGRHNLYVKDSKIYKVEVEGLATDN